MHKKIESLAENRSRFPFPDGVPRELEAAARFRVTVRNRVRKGTTVGEYYIGKNLLKELEVTEKGPGPHTDFPISFIGSV
jgi:hypothetical protein